MIKFQMYGVMVVIFKKEFLAFRNIHLIFIDQII